MHAVSRGISAITLMVGVALAGSASAQHSPVGRGSDNPARRSPVAQASGASHVPQGAVRQVAGPGRISTARRGPGLLNLLGDSGQVRTQPASRGTIAQVSGGSLLGRLGIGDDDDDGRRVIEAAPQQGEPDWTGVPYHTPTRSSTAKNSTPITDPQDPSNRSAAVPQATPAARVATTRNNSRTLSAIPQPPAEAAPYRPRSGPSSSSASSTTRSSRTLETTSTSVPKLETSTYQPLSATESSRRSDRRTVHPLDASLALADPAASSATAPVDPPSITAESPRVTRRTVPLAATETQATIDVQAPAASSPRAVAAGSEPAEPTAEPITNSSTEVASSVPAASAPGTVASPDAGGWQPKSAAAWQAVGNKISSSLSAAEEGPQTSPASIPSATASALAASATTESETAAPAKTGPAEIALPNGVARTPSETAAGLGRGVAGLTATADAKPAQQLAVTPQITSPGSNHLTTEQTVVNAPPLNVEAEIPGIRVLTKGPSEIPVRQSTTYIIVIENRGQIDAPGAVVQLALPSWIQIGKIIPSRGNVEREQGAQGSQTLWMVDGLPAASAETITLELTAKEARQFDVAIEWAVVPKTTTAHVTVREPKLELLIEGPDQVVYGESQTYKVRVLNPGNGTAEGVVFTLSPNSETPQSQRIGQLAPGKEAQFEVVLAARDMEDLKIHGLAVADLGLKIEHSKSIHVVASRLQATLSGPPLKYQDSEATYKLQLENEGTVACEKIVATVELPAGVVYQGGIDGAVQNGSQLRWQIARLDTGKSEEFTLRCLMQRTGQQEIAFHCQGTAAGSTRVAFVTEVEALADLVLAINDPTAPAPVDDEVTYEIVVRNRGAKTAEGVETVVHFGFDIEPIRIEGGTGKIEPGQVTFDAIERIEAGTEVTLKVIAKADKAGLHRCRTEVRCGDTLLVSEEATRYLQLAGERVSRRSDEAKAPQ